MANLAIIPARGGSKRIPRKNVKDFLGKPILAYSIEAALESGLFEEVMVSTDDKEIAEIAKYYGAAVPFMRSAETSDDHSTLSDVLMEVLGEYEARKRTFENLCCLFATAPFVTDEKLKAAYQKLLEGDFVSIVSVQEYQFPILRSLKTNQAGYLEMNWPEYAKTRSQDLAPAFHDAGQFYWARMKDYLLEQKFYSSNDSGYGSTGY